MTAIAMTTYGEVSGTSPALVAAAADLLESIETLPTPRRMAELVAAVSLPIVPTLIAA
jgi:hypothetical protein